MHFRAGCRLPSFMCYCMWAHSWVPPLPTSIALNRSVTRKTVQCGRGMIRSRCPPRLHAVPFFARPQQLRDWSEREAQLRGKSTLFPILRAAVYLAHSSRAVVHLACSSLSITKRKETFFLRDYVHSNGLQEVCMAKIRSESDVHKNA